jgi:hypothetical protein
MRMCVFVEDPHPPIQASTLITWTLKMCTNLDVFRQCPLILVKVGWRGSESLETEEDKETVSKLIQVT